MFSCLRRSDRRESDSMGHIYILHNTWQESSKSVEGNENFKKQKNRYQ